MRSIAAALVALVLPIPAQAQFTSQPMPAGSHAPGTVGKPRAPVPLPVRVEVRHGPLIGTADRDLRLARESIRHRRERGELTREQARSLRREAALIESRRDRYARDGISDNERAELQLSSQSLLYRAQTRTVPQGSP